MRDWTWYNFARVNIYFSEAQIVEIVEVRSISLTTLLANIGGTVGLWAGLSVVSGRDCSGACRFKWRAIIYWQENVTHSPQPTHDLTGCS